MPASSRKDIAVMRFGSESTRSGGVVYTIATLVNDRALYSDMRTSFRSGGFDLGDCEYLSIDNTGPAQTSAYAGLNAMLNEAQGRYVILCHQDVRLLIDDRATLDSRLTELESTDANWALAGNAGAVAPGKLAIRITDPHGADQRVGDLPARVMSLDENFIVAKRSARIGFSNDLEGFHFYGADICLMADLAGYAAYVIDFHLAHLSAGNKTSAGFEAAEAAFRDKWSRALEPRWMQTTCSLVRLSGDKIGQIAARLTEVPFAKLTKRMPGAEGWKKQPRPVGE